MAVGGKRPGAGRKKGSPNKTTAQVKDAILKAFDTVGGPAYLEDVARENPAIFCQLLGKVLPKDIVAEVTTKTHEEALRELE